MHFAAMDFDKRTCTATQDQALGANQDSQERDSDRTLRMVLLPRFRSNAGHPVEQVAESQRHGIQRLPTTRPYRQPCPPLKFWGPTF